MQCNYLINYLVVDNLYLHIVITLMYLSVTTCNRPSQLHTSYGLGTMQLYKKVILCFYFYIQVI